MHFLTSIYPSYCTYRLAAFIYIRIKFFKLSHATTGQKAQLGSKHCANAKNCLYILDSSHQVYLCMARTWVFFRATFLYIENFMTVTSILHLLCATIVAERVMRKPLTALCRSPLTPLCRWGCGLQCDWRSSKKPR